MNHLVWRVENIHGGGMYRGVHDGGAFFHIADKHGVGGDFTSNSHPTPCNDTILAEKWRDIVQKDGEKHWHFCFKSIQQLKDWTVNPNVRAEMEEYGFIVRVFSVAPDSVVIGDKQAIFKKDEAKRVAEFSPMEIDVVTDIQEYNADLFDAWSVVFPSRAEDNISTN